jgi:hypothetical protein
VTENKVPENLNWVKARAECSLVSVLKELEHGAREDVEAAKLLVKPHEHIEFSVVANPRRVSVIREDAATSAAPIPVTRDVNFVIEGQEIIVSTQNQILLRATITVNNEGLCKLVVKNEELEQWQVRKMALEKLFFGPFA